MSRESLWALFPIGATMVQHHPDWAQRWHHIASIRFLMKSQDIVAKYRSWVLTRSTSTLWIKNLQSRVLPQILSSVIPKQKLGVGICVETWMALRRSGSNISSRYGVSSRIWPNSMKRGRTFDYKALACLTFYCVEHMITSINMFLVYLCWFSSDPLQLGGSADFNSRSVTERYSEHRME